MNTVSTGLLVATAVLTAAGPLGIDMYLPGLPTLQADLNTTPVMAQLTITAFTIGMATGNLLAGAISDSTGRKRPVVIGSAVFLLAWLTCALAPSIEVLIAGRLVQGLAGGTCMVVSRAIIPDVVQGRQAAKLYSVLMAIMGFASTIAPVIGGALLPAVGWRGVFWVLAAVNLVQIIVAIFILPETLPVEKRSGKALKTLFPRIGRCLARPEFVGYLLATALGFGVLFSYIASSPLVLQGMFGVSPTIYSIIFGTMALLLPLSSSVNIRVVSSIHPRKALLTALTVDLVAGVFLLLQSSINPSIVTVILNLAVLSMMAGFIMANAMSLGTETVRDIGTGAGSGAIGCFQFIIAATVPPLVALGSNPLRSMSISVMVCAVIALGSLLLLTRQRSEPQD